MSKRSYFSNLCILGFSCLFLGSQSIGFGQGGKDKESEVHLISVQSSHFTLSGPESSEKYLQGFGELCDQALQRLTGDFKFHDSGKKFFVYVSPDARDFESRTRLRAHSTMAVAFPDQGRMVLNGPALKRVTPSERFRVVGHELVHLILGELARGRSSVPYWLHEGLAQGLVEPISVSARWRLFWTGFKGKRLSMTELIREFPYGSSQSALAYAQSASFTRFVATESYGFNQVEGFFRFLIQNPDRAQIILARLQNVSLIAEIEAEWYVQVRKSPSWIQVLTSATVIWFFVVALFFLAMLRRRQKSRIVMEDWDPWERE